MNEWMNVNGKVWHFLRRYETISCLFASLCCCCSFWNTQFRSPQPRFNYVYTVLPHSVCILYLLSSLPRSIGWIALCLCLMYRRRSAQLFSDALDSARSRCSILSMQEEEIWDKNHFNIFLSNNKYVCNAHCGKTAKINRDWGTVKSSQHICTIATCAHHTTLAATFTDALRTLQFASTDSVLGCGGCLSSFNFLLFSIFILYIIWF